MNASLYKNAEHKQNRPTIAQLHEVIQQIYLWQSHCKAELRSSNLSSSTTDLEVFNQLLQDQQLNYEENQAELGKLVYGLLQKYDPLLIFSLLSGHHLSLEQAKHLDNMEANPQVKPLDEVFTSDIQVIDQRGNEPVETYLTASSQGIASGKPHSIVEVPSGFSIGQAVWKPSHEQLQQLHNPQKSKKKSVKVKPTPTFKSPELALNHLTHLLDQDYSNEEFARELKKVLKSSPLDKRDSRLCELLVDVDLPNGKVFKALRKAVRDYQNLLESDEHKELDAPVEPAWSFAPHFIGKHIELVGGNPRVETVTRLEKVLPGASIHWTRAEGKVGDKQLGALKRQARSGSIDVVLLITAFMGHTTSRHFMPLNRLELDENGRRLNVRLVRGGYGLSKLKAELINCLN